MSPSATTSAAVGAPHLDLRAVAGWRATWYAMMREYLPYDEALAAAFDAVDAALPAGPRRILDLGGGPGLVAELALCRWPRCEATLLDVDPVLLALARAALPPRAAVLDCDFAAPTWGAAVGGEFDVVLAVMVVHYLAPASLDALYRQVRRRLRRGGMLLIVDVIADPGLPTFESGPQTLGSAVAATADELQSKAATWKSWWRQVGGHPAMAGLVDARRRRLAAIGSAEFTLTVDGNRVAMAAAGFGEARVVWRWGKHAVMVATV